MYCLLSCSVGSHHVSCRSEAVAIKGSTNRDTIREDEEGWAIPRLLHGLVVAVESVDVWTVLQLWLTLVRLWYEDHEGFLDSLACLDVTVKGTVQIGTVTSANVHKGASDMLLVSLSEERPELVTLSTLHPIDIAEESVDLSVVR